MSKKKHEAAKDPDSPDTGGFKVVDRRFWADGGTVVDETPSAEVRIPASDKDRIIQELGARLKKAEEGYLAFKERLERDLGRQVEAAIQTLLPGVLDALDSMDRVSASAPTADKDQLLRGITLVSEQLLGSLARLGIRRVDPTGTAFDPAVHEAVSIRDEKDPAMNGKVVAVIRPAYLLGDRLVRPAQVIVGRG